MCKGWRSAMTVYGRKHIQLHQMRKEKMTIFDYLKKNCEVAISTDEYGNTYMETKEREYYKRHKIEQANPAYLRKCIEAYGLDVDKKLGKVPEYIWRAD